MSSSLPRVKEVVRKSAVKVHSRHFLAIVCSSPYSSFLLSFVAKWPLPLIKSPGGYGEGEG